MLDVHGSLQLLNSSHVRERERALLRSIMVGGVWNGFLLGRVRSGSRGDAKLIVSVGLGSSAVFGGVSPVWMMKATCAGLAMVTFLSWMVNVRTSSFIVRTLAGNKNGSTLRSVGSNNMFLPVLCLGQE